jgi:hypothetical protein
MAEQQEQTLEGMVISDLSSQIAQTSVDRAAWSARARIAEQLLEEAQARVLELEGETKKDTANEDEDKK